MTRLLLLILALLVPTFAAAAPPPVILVSIDGFRASYLDRGVTPNLAELAAGGAVSKGMRPSYPTLTFPNHYTLVTGLRPDHHGIVDNNMRDPRRPGVNFSMSARAIADDRFWWDGGTPIWITAEQAGLRTATMFWPGSEVDIQGVRPTRYLKFNQSILAARRVDQVLAWMDEIQPAFMTLYFDDVDTSGHNLGPDGPGVNEALSRIDGEIGRLRAGLKARGVEANLIVVADHGMAPVSRERVTYLDDLLPADRFEMVTRGTLSGVIPVAGHEAEVRKALIGRHENMTCWPKEKMPRRYHYGTHIRIPPILCLARTGWLIERHGVVSYRAGGAHGFDPYDPTMAALFIANGPAIRPGVTLGQFDNVDVHPLICELLDLTCPRGDGRLGSLRRALVPAGN
jgi:hypothetical protein